MGDSHQLAFLFEGEEILRLPWGGRSPRALTRVALSLILKTQGEKSMGDFVDPEQYDLWLPIKKRSPSYAGASPLVPLPRRTHGSRL